MRRNDCCRAWCRNLSSQRPRRLRRCSAFVSGVLGSPRHEIARFGDREIGSFSWTYRS